MKLDNILTVDAFFFPGKRDRLPKIFRLLKARRIPECVDLMMQHSKEVGELLGRDVDVDMKELIHFLVIHHSWLLGRLRTIRIRAGELTGIQE